ncbi:hypothetical protein C8R45DRAFT_318109 [Mycena sanguinolenta]|nr:hypothetical protein C8R45DRAFT_318109 [Mycena sanguinolenta]
MNMGHGPGLLALVLNLYLVLSLGRGALAQGPPGQPHSSHSLASSLSSASSSSSASQSSDFSASSSQGVSSVSSSVQSSASLTSRTRHSTSSTTSSVFTTSNTTGDDTALSSSTSDPTPPDPTSPPDSTTSPDSTISPDGPTSNEVSSSPTSISVLSSPHSSSHVPIIAGVVAPVCLIIIAAIALVLYKRRQRARDRREWERTHEAIADAVRQVGSPVPRSVAPYAGSGTWSHLDLTKGSGDTVTNPFTDEPVAHQSAEQAAAPTFRPVRSPTFRSTHSPALSQTYAPFNVQDDAQSGESTAESSVHFQSHPDDHAI